MPMRASLLQVKVKEADDADDIFTKLMGDVVEPAPRIHPGECADGERRCVMACR